MTSPNTIGEDRKQGSVVLECDVPLSQSRLWRWQREFYAQRGLKVWSEDMVPHFITNNPFIAELYARIVFAFLCDCRKAQAPASPADSRQPVLRVLELGAGTGKFAYLFLRQLAALLRASKMAPEIVRYRMVDCSQESLENWRANSRLAEFAERGILEFELLQDGHDADGSDAGTGSGRGPGLDNEDQQTAPQVVIANYVFDSLPQDAFEIEQGELREVLMTTASDTAESNRPPLSQLHLSFKTSEVAPNRYEDELWNRVLKNYSGRLSRAKLSFPSGALALLQKLLKTAGGEMLVLAADKGVVHEQDLALAQGWPAFDFHAPNCFSQMVNFDAIGKYFEANGGTALKPEKHSASLSICAFLHGRSSTEFPATAATYQAAQEAFGVDDLFNMLAWLNAHMEEVSVAQALAILRLSRWDPVALMRLFPVIAPQLRGVSMARHDLRDAVIKVWNNHYPVSAGEEVLSFQCAVILLELGFFADAIPMFQISQRTLGPSAATSYNLGLCSQGLERPAEALAFMTEACALDPSFEPAKLARAKLEEDRARG